MYAETLFRYVYGIGMEEIAKMTPERFCKHYEMAEEYMKLRSP